MAWDWSHSPEAYRIARQHLENWSAKRLGEAYAEFKCKEIDDANEQSNVQEPDPYKDGRYEKVLNETRAVVRKFGKEHLVNEVWRMAEELHTCDNGGATLWVCPYGCHKVSCG